MNLRQVEIFSAVMRCRTMVAAAFELGVSQPAVSAAIKHLEAQLGLTLFERVGNRLVPTAEAHALARDTEPLQAMSNALAARVLDLRRARTGHLRVLATPAVGRSVVARALAGFLGRRPAVQAFFDLRRMEGVVESIECGFADLGVVLTPTPRPGVRIVPVVKGRMVVALPADHRLARRAALTPDDLQEERLIGLEAASRLGALVRHTFDRVGAPYRPGIEVRHCASACMLVEQGLGVAVVDEFSAHAESGWHFVTRPFVPEIEVTLSAMHLADRPASRLVGEFLEDLQRTAQAMAGQGLSQGDAPDHGRLSRPP